MAALMRSKSAFSRIFSVVSRSRSITLSTKTPVACRWVHGENSGIHPIRSLSTSFWCSQQTSNAINNKFRRQGEDGNSSADQALQALDREVRRVGRIREEMFNDVLVKVVASNKLAGHQSLVMLRCLGSLLVDEKPEDRTKLVLTFWDDMQKLGSPRDTMHYNALMKVHLQNEHAFSPTEMLAEIQAKGLAPNRVTFQRLIERYCQDGDMEGAKEILTHMKTQNVPINELVFNSLIMGHTRAGDEASAKGILKIMKDAGIAPTGDTYAQILHGYARQGNVDAIFQTISEAKETGVHFHPNHYIEVIVRLCGAGHGQYTQQIMDKCPRTLGFNQDCMNGALQLVARDHPEHAVTIFLNMNHPKVTDEVGEVTHARFMTKAMIKHGMDLHTLSNILADLSERRLSTDGSSFIAKWALVYGQAELAANALHLMSEEGQPIRTHYFWPLYVAMKKKKDTEGIYGAVETAEKLVTESSDFISTLHEYVVPSLLKLGESEMQIQNRLQDMKILSGDTRFALMIHYLKEREVERAVALCKEGNVRINQSVLSPQLRDLISVTAVPVEHILELLTVECSFTSSRFHPADINGNALFDLISKRRLNEEQTAHLVQQFVDRNIGVSPGQAVNTKTLLDSKQVPDDLSERLLSIQTNVEDVATRRRDDGGDRMSEKTIEQLEPIAAAGNKTAKKWLLYKLCIEGDVTRAEELKKELESIGFIMMPDLLRQLWYLSAFHKRDLAEALSYKEKLELEYSDYGLYANNVLHTACLIGEKGDVQGVLDILDDYHRRHHAHMEERQYSEDYKLENTCSLLIKAVQDGGNVEAGRQVMEKLFDLGFVKKGTYSLLKQYINGYIEKEDVGGMIDAMQFVSETHDRSPEYQHVFRLLIEKEDSENLQKVMDMVSVSFGEMHALHHLVSALIQCGQVEKARKIIETPGIRALNDVLDKTCQFFTQTGKMTELEALVDITKGMFGLDRETMLFYLIKGYSRVPNVDKALETFTLFEEENVSPRPRTLRYLSKVLQTHGRDVPFDVPEIVNRDGEEQQSSYSTAEQDALEKGASGVVPGLHELKEKLGGSFRADFLHDLTKVVYSSRRPGSLKFLVYELASMGDVESLQVLKTMNMQVLNRGLIHAAIFRAHIESNRPDDCITLMENESDLLSRYLNTKTINLFKRTYPNMYPRFEELCLRASENGDMVVAGFLWNSAVMLAEYTEADEIVKRFPQLMETLRIATVCVDAKNNDDEEKLNYIVEACKDNPVSSAFAYSYLIGLHNQHGNHTASLNCVERAQSKGLTLEQLRPQALAALEDLLTKHEQQPPWQPGQFSHAPVRAKGRNVARDQSSSPSSSSDSSSDDSESSDEEVTEQRT